MFKKVDKLIETNIPTLICGWAKVKEMYPNQKITNKKISDTIFWTFSEKEKRTENSNDIQNFKKYCVDVLDSKYNYFFLNPFELTLTNLKNLINRINGVKEDRICYYDEKHFFIMVENYIFGINMDFLFNSRITQNKIKKWLKTKNFKIFEDSVIFNKEEIRNKKYLIPIFGKDNYEEQLIIGYIFE